MPARKLPPTYELVKLYRSGMTHKEIAEKVSEEIGEPVSRVSITLALSRAGEEPRAKRYKDEIPWTVASRHSNEYPARMLRLLGRRNAGQDLTETDEGKLNRWLSWLQGEDAVVAYSPMTDPGFRYVLADEADDNVNGIPVRPRTIAPEEIIPSDDLDWVRELTNE